MERAAPRFPIWPCTRWGFPCLRSLALGAVGSYPTFSPLPDSSLRQAVCSLWHFPSGCLATSPPACIHGPAGAGPGGYAASRPMEFGLSSPGTNPGAILRPSKSRCNVSGSGPLTRGEKAGNRYCLSQDDEKAPEGWSSPKPGRRKCADGTKCEIKSGLSRFENVQTPAPTGRRRLGGYSATAMSMSGV